MDRQIKAKRAWLIPQKIFDVFGTHDFKRLTEKEEKDFIDIFQRKNLHRFNNDMAKVFYDGIQRIKNRYDGDASKIWKNNPSSALVVYRFLEFKGCGIKIATMAANILARQYKIPFADYYSINISPDVHVKRVMKRMGYVDNDSPEIIIYKARQLYPEFPGIIDFSCWEIGRKYCTPTNPDCKNCIVSKSCKKVFKKIPKEE